MNIIVLNLPRETNNDQLADLFKHYGCVDSCELILDRETGTSKGFGFVTMKHIAEGNAAIAALHNSRVGSNKIRVKIAEKK